MTNFGQEVEDIFIPQFAYTGKLYKTKYMITECIMPLNRKKVIQG